MQEKSFAKEFHAKHAKVYRKGRKEDEQAENAKLMALQKVNEK